jgi:hypothetical protein
MISRRENVMTVKPETKEVNSWCKVLLVIYPTAKILPYRFDWTSRIQVAGLRSRQGRRCPEALAITVIDAFYFFHPFLFCIGAIYHRIVDLNGSFQIFQLQYNR